MAEQTSQLMRQFEMDVLTVVVGAPGVTGNDLQEATQKGKSLYVLTQRLKKRGLVKVEYYREGQSLYACHYATPVGEKVCRSWYDFLKAVGKAGREAIGAPSKMPKAPPKAKAKK